MTVPSPPPPPAPGADRTGRHRAASLALAASISGFVVLPVAGPLIGIVVGFAVVWALRADAPNGTSRLAAIAVAVGAAGVAVPVVAILFLRDRGNVSTVLVALVVLSVVIGTTLHLAGVGGRATLAVSAGSVVAVIATTAAAIGAVLLATWILVTIGRLIFTAVFGATTTTIGVW